MSNFSDTTIVPVELSTGATIPLRPIKAKSGNTYHAVLKSDGRGGYKHPGKFGVKVAGPVVGGKLPESVVVNGERIRGTYGESQGGNPKVSFSARIDVPGLGERMLRLTISSLKDGNFNVGGSLNRPGGSSGAPAAESL